MSGENKAISTSITVDGWVFCGISLGIPILAKLNTPIGAEFFNGRDRIKKSCNIAFLILVRYTQLKIFSC